MWIYTYQQKIVLRYVKLTNPLFQTRFPKVVQIKCNVSLYKKKTMSYVLQTDYEYT